MCACLHIHSHNPLTNDCQYTVNLCCVNKKHVENSRYPEASDKRDLDKLLTCLLCFLLWSVAHYGEVRLHSQGRLLHQEGSRVVYMHTSSFTTSVYNHKEVCWSLEGQGMPIILMYSSQCFLEQLSISHVIFSTEYKVRELAKCFLWLFLKSKIIQKIASWISTI